MVAKRCKVGTGIQKKRSKFVNTKPKEMVETKAPKASIRNNCLGFWRIRLAKVASMAMKIVEKRALIAQGFHFCVANF